MSRRDPPEPIQIMIGVEISGEDAERFASMLVEAMKAHQFNVKQAQARRTASPEVVARMLGASYTSRAVVNLCKQGRLRFHRKSDAPRSPYCVHLDSVEEFLRGQ